MVKSLTYLNWVDYSILGIVLLSTVISFFRGLIREAISVIVWLAGILIALKFAAPFSVYFKTWVTMPAWRYSIAFIILFVLVFIVGIAVNAIIHLAIKKVGLSATDRVLGIIFGAIRGLLIVAVLLMFASVDAGIKVQHDLKKSHLAPKFKPIVSWLHSFLPQHIKQLSHWVTDETAAARSSIEHPKER